MSEFTRPEDLLETEGPEKGRIKDKSLAEIGAEEEDAFRSGGSTFLGEDFRRDHTPDSAGTQKMFNEVFDRSTRQMTEKGILDEGFKDWEAEQDASAFSDEQERLRKEREEQAQKDYVKNKYPDKKS